MATSLWLIGQWVLMIFFHPGWVLGWGTILAVWLGAGFAGADAHEGAEEFALALPPQRAQRYHVRLGMSLSFLVLLLGVSLLAIHYNGPQRLWGLVVESGFTGPFRDEDSRVSPWLYYGLAIACPLAAYGGIVWNGLPGLYQGPRGTVSPVGPALHGGRGCLWGRGSSRGFGRGYQDHLITGQYSFAVLGVLALLYLALGYVGYRRKDGIARPRGTKSPEWRAGLALAAILLLVLILVPVVLAVVPREWLIR